MPMESINSTWSRPAIKKKQQHCILKQAVKNNAALSVCL